MGGKTNSTDDAGASSGDVDDLGAADDNHHNVQLALGSDHQKMSKYLSKAFKFIKPNHLMSREEYPAEINQVFELSSDGNEIGCFLWQRSIFYSKALFGSHAFHLRWFIITPQRICSSPGKNAPRETNAIITNFIGHFIASPRQISRS